MCGVVESFLACQMPDPGSLPRIDDSVPSRVRVNSRILYALSINRDIDKFILPLIIWTQRMSFHHAVKLLRNEPGGLAGLPKNPFYQFGIFWT